MAEREAEAARQCSQQKGALSESPGQQYSRNRNMGALLGLQGINCFAMTFQKPERPRKNIRNNFFQKKKKKTGRFLGKMLVWHSPQRLTVWHILLCVLQLSSPQENEGSGRRASFCASLFGEKKKLRTVLHRDLQGRASVSSAFLPHGAQHRSPWWHICQTILARQPVRGLALLFQSTQGLSLNQHLEQREKKGTQPLCQTLSLSFTLTVLHLWMFTLMYVIYTESSCASNRRDCQTAVSYLWKWPEWCFVS